MKLWSTIALSLLLGCTAARPRVHPEELKPVKRLGLLSVTIDKIGTDPADVAVLESVATHAVGMYQSLLGTSRYWELVPPSEYENKEVFKDFIHPSRSEIFRTVAAQLVQGGDVEADMDALMSALMSGNTEEMKQVSSKSAGAVAEQVEELMDQERTRYVSAPGFAFLPYSLINREQGHVKAVLKAIGQLATELRLDAFAIAYHRTSVQPDGKQAPGGRALATLRMAPTLLVINRNGAVAIDTGFPVMDEKAKVRTDVPLYRAAAVGQNLKVELQDPQKKVPGVLTDITSDAALSLSAGLETELMKMGFKR